ncbi:MAG: hypothetical protein PHU06_03665 [Gallionella sp.]|nr:hypothetical protein [Gallionella sp.]MDD4959295.1 hypothetical protein [Gallionella sp.]
MNKISFKGVVLGSITDIVATNILVIPLILYITATRHLDSIPKEQFSEVLLQTLKDDPLLHTTQLLIGSFCSILGGYVAARVAKHDEILNGTLAAFLCVGSGLYALIFTSSHVPVWQHLVAFVASPALSAFGGFLCLRAMRVKSIA